jgi:hypothetical protein
VRHSIVELKNEPFRGVQLHAGPLVGVLEKLRLPPVLLLLPLPDIIIGCSPCKIGQGDLLFGEDCILLLLLQSWLRNLFRLPADCNSLRVISNGRHF